MVLSKGLIHLVCLPTHHQLVYTTAHHLTAQKNLLLWIIRTNLNLDPHIIPPQPRHPDRRPNRLMIRHPLPKLATHRLHRLIVQRQMVRVDSKYLTPALPAGVLQHHIYGREGLGNLRVDFGGHLEGCGVPAAWRWLVTGTDC
jgi:hypothetical protein